MVRECWKGKKDIKVLVACSACSIVALWFRVCYGALSTTTQEKRNRGPAIDCTILRRVILSDHVFIAIYAVCKRMASLGVIVGVCWWCLCSASRSHHVGSSPSKATEMALADSLPSSQMLLWAPYSSTTVT